MRIWLDDERPMPEGFDVHVKTANAAIEILRLGTVTYISLDHDLGPPEAGTGYDVALYIEEGAYNLTLMPLEWAVHSANPVGVKKMEAALNNAVKWWALT